MNTEPPPLETNPAETQPVDPAAEKGARIKRQMAVFAKVSKLIGTLPTEEGQIVIRALWEMWKP